jgi:hypothetical protein
MPAVAGCSSGWPVTLSIRTGEHENFDEISDENLGLDRPLLAVVLVVGASVRAHRIRVLDDRLSQRKLTSPER